ncbi:MAG: DUF2298 domain-containing protein, partial [Chloroflexota bacterium]
PEQFLLINGALLFVVVSFLAYRLARSAAVARALSARAPVMRSAPTAAYLSAIAPTISLSGEGNVSTVATGLLLLVVALWAVGYGTLGIIVLAGGIAAALAVVRRSSRETLFVVGITAAALGAFAFPEVVSVKGDVGRMNTVFKFFLESWILLSVLAGPAAVMLWRSLFQGRRGGSLSHGRLAAEGDVESDGGTPELLTPAAVSAAARYIWAGLLIVLVAACAVYPILATRTKVPLRFESLPPTLDGMAFMQFAAYRDREKDLDLPSDYQAIRWMLEHVEGSPVILEGTAPLYHWGARYSIYTGLPAVIGWDWHQKQQRWGYQEKVDQRQRDVNRFYETPDPQLAWSIVDRYDVSFIVVGGLERAYYPAAGLAKLDRMVGDGLEVVYRQGSVTIYQVVRP